MAVIVSKSPSENGGNPTSLATVNGFWQAEAWNLSAYSTTNLALSTKRTISVTFAHAGNCQGIVIALGGASNYAASGMRNVVVDLKEGSSVRASITLTGEQIANSVSACGSYWIVPIRFDTPYPVTTASSTWSFDIYQGAGGGTWTLRTSNGTAPFFITWCDTVISFSNDDVLVVIDPVIIDKTASIKGSTSNNTGDNTHGVAAVICRVIDPTPTNVANLRWQNPPVQAYTFTVDGVIMTARHCGIRIGTAESRIPIAQQGTLTFTLPTSGTIGGTKDVTDVTFNGGSATSFFAYGEVPAIARTTLAETCPLYQVTFMSGSPVVVVWPAHPFVDGDEIWFGTTGTMYTGLTPGVSYYIRSSDSPVPVDRFWLYDTQEHALAGGETGRVNTSGTQSGYHYASRPYIVTTDVTGWQIGDSVFVGRHNRFGSSDWAERTIAAINGTQIRLSTPFTDAGRIAGGEVVRTNGYGFKITGINGTNSTGFRMLHAANMVIDGCEVRDVVWNLASSATVRNEETAYTSQWVFQDLSAYYSTFGTTGQISFLTNNISIYDKGVLFRRCNFVRGRPYTQMLASSSTTIKAGNMEMDQCWILMTSGAIGSTANSLVCRVNIHNNRFSSPQYEGLCLTGIGPILEDNWFWGTNTSSGYYALMFYGVLGTDRIRRNHYDKCGTAIRFGSHAMSGFVDTDSEFGQIAANSVDIDFNPESYAVGEFVRVIGINTIMYGTNLLNASAGSVLRFTHYNGTVGDYRSFWREGKTESVSSSMRMVNLLEPTPLVVPFRLATQAVSGGKLFLSIGCQIENAAYYAGVNDAPQMVLTFDGSSTSTQTATLDTTRQVISAAVTLNTDNNPLEIDLKTCTDATMVDAGVLWDTMLFNIRKYGKVFQTLTVPVERYIPDVIYTFSSYQNNSRITEMNEAVVGAYSGISINHGTQTCTITGVHSIQELYDYVQWDLCQDVNLEYSEWLTTLDGITYTSTYNIIVNGVVLSGTGKNLNLGTKTFTTLNNGSTTMKVSDLNGTLVAVTLNGVTVGSQCYIAKVSDGTEIMNLEATSSIVAINYQHTVDTDVVVRVRKFGYLESISYGTITNNGFSVVVNQVVDGNVL